MMIRDHELLNLIFKLEDKESCKVIELTQGAAAEVIGFLQELQDRRESDIKPCDKYLSNSIGKQLAHIDTEQKEALDELRDYVSFQDINNEQAEKARQAALIELTDWQTSIETLKTILEPDKQVRRKVRKKVIAKNNKRGYYREDD